MRMVAYAIAGCLCGAVAGIGMVALFVARRGGE